MNASNRSFRDQPTDEEFDEYVAYAVECRRRVKEQMNKRKPDDEFARIDLSYFSHTGREVVIYCPESQDAPATQQPTRRSLRTQLAILKAATLARRPEDEQPT